MELSMTSDYARGTGSPEPYLRRIAEAGFTHIHWCHQWNTDFHYVAPELDQIASWMGSFGLSLLDLHGSAGPEKNWTSPVEYERLAGVDLVTNRLEMTARLGGRVTIMHVPTAPADAAEADKYWDRVRRSLDALEPVSRATGVRIAIENGSVGHFATVERILSLYPPEYVGLCYDSGHGNVSGEGLDYLERLRGRLIAMHLHDNDATADQHKPLFTGTVDWERLARIIATSSYTGPLSQELSIRLSGFEDESAFLAQARADGERLTRMVEAARTA